MNKKGVSLVTVLMLMLVATIAATATYKWLASENKSSGARMLQTEAGQAAIAGIEAARSWMTYHGSETGAIIKQYFDNSKQPVKLDSRLGAESGPNGSSFSVSMVGVEISGNNYKVKVVSTGEARNGSKYSETAIFKVSGLYRVEAPVEQAEYSSPDYAYAYFGASTSYSGDHGATAMLINGNWSGNPISTDDDFIVTGNVELSGNVVNVGKTLCVGGNLGTGNHFKGKDVYVVGDAGNNTLSFSGSITGNAYFNGNIKMGSSEDFTVGGNMTLGGTFNTNLGGHLVAVNGDLCIEESGKVNIDSDNHSFTVENDVYIPGHNAISRGTDNYEKFQQIILGNKSTSKVYIADAYPYNDYKTLRTNKTFTETNGWIWRRDFNSNKFDYWSGDTYSPYPEKSAKNNLYYMYYLPTGTTDVEFKMTTDPYWQMNVGSYFVGGNRYRDMGDVGTYNFLNYENDKMTGSPYCYGSKGNWSWGIDLFRPTCKVSPWFKSEGAVSRTMPSTPLQCGNPVKTYCEQFWQKKTGCDGSGYKVDDILKTGLNKFEAYANKPGCAKNITEYNNDIVTKLNSCYADTRSNNPDDLYNDYLVVKLKSPQKKDPQGTLQGKFVMIFDDALSQQGMAPTEAGSYVFLYLKKGTSGELLQTGSGTYNYFVYTEADIAQIQGSEWTGSFYARVGDDGNLNCAKIKNINGNTKLTYSQTIVDDMAKSGLICSAKQTADCAPSTGTTASSSSATSTSGGKVTSQNGYDTYHIAIGTQLSIEMESQYKTTESVGKTQDISPSIVVLPRVIYLNKDAPGKLSDYYSVMRLNSSNTSSMSGSVSSCTSGAPPTTGEMTASGDMTPGTYTCTYSEGDLSSHFFIIVSGAAASTPSVHFDFPEATNLNASEATSNVVKLVVDAVTSTTPVPFSVDIVVKNPNLGGWTLTPSALLTERPGTHKERIFTYQGTAGTEKSTIDAFTIATNGSAASGSVLFMLQAPENATLGSPAVKSFSIVGTATIKRKGVDAYCQEYAESCTGNNAKYAAAANIEDCNLDGEWVTANGLGCRDVIGGTNNEWACDAGNGNNYPITLKAVSPGSLCELLLPTENNSVVGALDNSEKPEGYTLYASLKRKRLSLKIKIEGTNSGEVVIKTKDTFDGPAVSTETCTNRSEGCEYAIYSGKFVEITADRKGDKFSSWKCEGSTCPQATVTAITYSFVQDNDYTYTARFNERDPNCFFTDFSNMGSVFCTSSGVQNCVDICNDGTRHCELGNGKYGKEPDWLMAYCNGGNNCSTSSDWIEPVTDAGFMHRETSNGNAASGNGTTAPILSRALAGGDGTMTASIKTSADESKKNLNSGFILRSRKDASDYIILGIYGFKSQGSQKLGTRICHIKDGQAQNENTAKCVVKSVSATLSNTDILDVSIKLEGTAIDVDVKRSGAPLASVTFNLLSDWSEGDFSDADHSYVGFSLSDNEFQVRQIGWKANNLSPEGTCSDYPSITCSFAAKYVGGFVPANENIQPWIGYSSWFDDKNCKAETPTFYYNGCDMSSSYFESWLSGIPLNNACSNSGSDGYYTYKEGSDGFKLNSDTYNFSWEGPHGISKDGGIVRNASVKVTCENVDYYNSCGRFTVGNITECSRNVAILTENRYWGIDAQEITFPEANLRGATLKFDAEMQSGDYVEVRLVDNNGYQSHIRQLTSTTSQFEVNNMGDVFGFNIEKVVKIQLKGSSSYTLKSITSGCPNALGVSCNSGKANYAGSSWTVPAKVSNASSTCQVRIVPKSSDIQTPQRVNCNTTSSAYSVLDNDFYARLNGGYDTEVTEEFTVEVYDDENSSTPVDQCSVQSSPYNKASVSCNISSNEIVQGLGVPTFSYTATNCPDYGCYYDVKLSDGTTLNPKNPEKIPQTGHSDTWKPAVNTSNNKLNSGSYTYTITLRNQDNTKSYGDCSKDFSVTEAASAQGNCYIEGSLLKYSIQGANNVSSIPVTLSGSDNLGNILGFATINMGELKEGQIDLSTQNLTAGQEYVFNISISGVEKRCGTYTPPTATSSSSTTSSNSQSGSLTANCKFTNNNDDYSNVLPGMNNLYFTVANLSGDGSEFNPTITYSWGGSKTIKCNTTCWENQVSVPTTVGTYTYTLSHNGSTICSATLNVVPPLTCSVSASEAQVNTEVTFSASTPASKCWNCSITGGKEAINNIGEWTQSAGLSQSVNVGTSSGKKTLKISCTCDNISAQCSQDVTAKAAAPSFDCGATIAKVGETNNVKIKLDNVQGCDDGCNYTIVGTSVTGNGYSSGNLPPFTGNGADGTSESFNVEITNSTETTTKSCKVDYSASGVIAINENDATDFAPGSYTVTCSGANTVSCWSADGTQGLSMNFNGTSCAIGGGAGWNNCGNNSCTSTPTTLQTNYDIKCKAMY